MPIIWMLAAQIAAYYGVRLLPVLRDRITMETAIDEFIPFCPFFIVFYIAAYAQWGIHMVVMAQEEDAAFRRFFLADLFSKGICLICFILIPSTMERPAVRPAGVFSSIVYLIYSVDRPVNLFPSIHCMLTWLDMRTAMKAKRAPSFYTALTVPFSLLVIVSTVLVKQHVFIDTVAGILTAEAGLLFSSLVPGNKRI